MTLQSTENKYMNEPRNTKVNEKFAQYFMLNMIQKFVFQKLNEMHF